MAWLVARVVAVEVKKGDHFGLEARGPTDGIHVGMIKKTGARTILSP